jgi:hypothetical protein
MSEEYEDAEEYGPEAPVEEPEFSILDQLLGEDGLDLEGLEGLEDDSEDSFYDNLAETASEDDLSVLAGKLLELLEIDTESNKISNDLYAEGLKRTGLSKEAPGGAGFDGAHKTVHPILAESAIDFQSRVLKEILPPTGPVKVDTTRKFDVDTYKKSKQKQKYLNDVFMKKMPEYVPSLEQLTAQVPLNGDQYLKIWWDRSKRRVACAYVPSDRMLVSGEAVSFYSAARKTEILHYTQYDYDNCVTSGLYRDIPDLALPSGDVDKSEATQVSERIIGVQESESTTDPSRKVYEIYANLCWKNLSLKTIENTSIVPEDEWAPYIVSIESSSDKIVSIYRNWEKDDPTRQELGYHVQWTFIPWRGPKGIGLVQLIGSLSGAMTGAIRALLDSAHIQNAPTALKLKFGKSASKSYKLEIGQINELEAEAGVNDIRQAFMALPFNPPSQVLYQLLGDLDKLARGVVTTSFDTLAESNANAPVGTTLNRIEQGLTVFSSIFSRFHRSQQRVIDIVCRLLHTYLDEEDFATFDDEQIKILRDDFSDNSDLAPISDPMIFSNSQRIAQSQLILELSDKAPDLYDRREAHRRMLEVSNVPNIESILLEPENQKDENPVTENVKMGMSSPAFALPDQDHLAHLEAHIRFAMSPAYGANKSWIKGTLPLLIDHIKQHILLHYAKVSVDLASQALGEPVENMINDHPMVMEGISRLIAIQSKDAMQLAESNVQQALQVLELLEQRLASIMPPPPIDPVQAQVDIAAKQNEVTLQTKMIDAQVKDKVSERQLMVEKEKLSQKEREMMLDDENDDGSRELQQLELAVKQEDLTTKRMEIDLKKKELMLEAGQAIELMEPEISATNLAIAGSMQSIADALAGLQKPKTVMRDSEGKIVGIV